MMQNNSLKYKTLKLAAKILISLSVIIAVSPASVLYLHQPKCPKQLR